MKITLRGVYAKHKKLACGSVRTYYYHRATNTRLLDEPGSAAFVARVQSLNAGPARPVMADETVGALMTRYLASGEFAAKAKGTRSEYRRHIDYIGDQGIKSFAVKDIRRKHVSAILDKFKDRPALADALRRTMSLLWSYAVDELGWMETNPLLRMKSRKSERPSAEGQRPLEEGEVRAIRAANPVGSRGRLIFELELGTALRRSDVARVSADALRDGRITLKTRKTGADIIAAPTQAMIEAFIAYESACAAVGKPIGRLPLAGRRDKPLGERSISAEIEEVFKRAGQPDELRSHALRYTAAVRLFELGYTYAEIAEVCGHQMAAMTKKYCDKARRAPLRARDFNRIDACTMA